MTLDTTINKAIALARISVHGGENELTETYESIAAYLTELKNLKEGKRSHMTFGEAIDKVRHGARISREGWNGKDQYVELARNISYVNAEGVTVNARHDAIGNQALAFVGTSGTQVGWLASQADMLASDWREV